MTARYVFVSNDGTKAHVIVESSAPVEWGAYTWGVATVLAISAAYVLLGILGHGVMRLVAGPAREDRLARWPWEAAQPAAGADR